MKRIGNLYKKIISLENLELADKNARRGKLWQDGVISHDKRRKQNTLELRNHLENGQFKTSKYSVFTLFDKKEREIFSLPYYPDRILQHAILQIISPIFIKSFISQTYSCIPTRGIHKALHDLNRSLKDKVNTVYCLKLDIKKFYKSINKLTLKKFLRRKFKDRDLLSVLDEIIDSNQEGIPIGNYLSQFLANFYLTYFDHWIKQDKKVIYYFRYMDDICILSGSKEYLNNLEKEIEDYLSNILDLELSKRQIFPVESRGIDFVGYVSFHDKILLRKSIKQNFKKMLLKYPNKRSISSYYGWLSHGNCVHLWNKSLNNLKEKQNGQKRSIKETILT